MRRLPALAVAAVLLAPVAAVADYYVYCNNNRIEVDSRGPEQMSVGRGTRLCQMGPSFVFLSDAQAYAERRFGGPGRACRCR